MSYHSKHITASPVERLIASACYIFPLVGFIFIVLSYLMKKDLRPFLKYHVFQSIFIAFALWVLVTGIGYAMNLFSIIPVVKNVVGMITFLINTPLFFGFSMVTLVYTVFVFYLILGALFGKASYVPWVSDIIKANLRGQI